MILMQYDFFFLSYCIYYYFDRFRVFRYLWWKGDAQICTVTEYFFIFFNIFSLFIFITFFQHKKKKPKKNLIERRIGYCLNGICVRGAQFLSFRLSSLLLRVYYYSYSSSKIHSPNNAIMWRSISFIIFWCAIFVRKINGFEVFGFVHCLFYAFNLRFFIIC